MTRFTVSRSTWLRGGLSPDGVRLSSRLWIPERRQITDVSSPHVACGCCLGNIGRALDVDMASGRDRMAQAYPDFYYPSRGTSAWPVGLFTEVPWSVIQPLMAPVDVHAALATRDHDATLIVYAMAAVNDSTDHELNDAQRELILARLAALADIELVFTQ